MSLYLNGIVWNKIHFYTIFSLIMFAYFLSCYSPIVFKINCIIIFVIKVKIPLIFLLKFELRPFIRLVIEFKFKFFSNIFTSLNGGFIIFITIKIIKLYPHSANTSHLMSRITFVTEWLGLNSRSTSQFRLQQGHTDLQIWTAKLFLNSNNSCKVNFR